MYNLEGKEKLENLGWECKGTHFFKEVGLDEIEIEISKKGVFIDIDSGCQEYSSHGIELSIEELQAIYDIAIDNNHMSCYT